jgi:hypothetical protein
MENKNSYERAKERVEGKIGFLIHLVVYVLVNGLLIVVNLITSPANLWFIYPMLGWGLGVLVHGLRTYVFTGQMKIPERMIQKEMEREA